MKINARQTMMESKLYIDLGSFRQKKGEKINYSVRPAGTDQPLL